MEAPAAAIKINNLEILTAFGTQDAAIQKYRWTHFSGTAHRGLSPALGDCVYTVKDRSVILGINGSDHRFDPWHRTVVTSKEFAAWLLFGPSTYRTQELVACFRLKLGYGIQNTSVSAAVGRMRDQSRGASSPQVGRKEGSGMTSKGHFFKGTIVLETDLIP